MADTSTSTFRSKIDVSKTWTQVVGGFGLARVCAVLIALMLAAGAPVHAGLLGGCLFDDANGLTGCTAGDIGVNNINVTLVSDGCINNGPDTATVNIDLQVNAAQPTRYDIGLFLSMDGGDAIATGGSCFHEALFPVKALDVVTTQAERDSGIGGYLNRDSDSCGEAENGLSYRRTLVQGDVASGSTTSASLQIACSDIIDENGAATPNGYVDLGWVATWDNNAQGVCTSIAQAIPGTSSKCQAGRTDSFNSLGIPIGIPSLGLTLTCDYTCVGPGDYVTCVMTYDNTGVGPADNIEYRIDFPETQGSISNQVVSCGSDSLTPSTGETGGGVSDYISLIPGGGSPPAVGNVAAGANCTYTFDFTVDLDEPDGSFVISAYTWFNNGTFETYQAQSAQDGACITPAVVSEFSTHHHNDQILTEWQTGVETGTVGFHLERLDPVAGEYVRLNSGLLPALVTEPGGGTYAFLDSRASHFGTPTYRLIAVDQNGATQVHGPYQPQISGLPVIRDFDAIQTNGFARKAHGPDPALIADWNVQRAERAAETLGNAAGESAASGVKIYTVGEGLFKINSAALAGMLGVPTVTVTNAVNAGSLELTYAGSPVKYLATADNSGLLFVAQDADSRYTDHSTYVATLPQNPVFAALYRMQEVQGFAPPVAADTAQTFMSWVGVEQDSFLVPYAVQDPDAEIWFSGFVSTGFYGDTTFSTTLAAPGVADAGDAEIRVQLLGLTDLFDGPDHHVQVRVNDVLVGEKTWDGFGSTEFSGVFDQSILVGGANSVTINGVLDTGIEQSSFLVDAVDLGYQRHFTAQDGSLRITPDGHRSITIGGFTGANIEVIELPGSQQPRRHRATLVEPSDGGYRVSFRVVNQDSEYLVVQRNVAQSPVEMLADLPSDLRNESNRADYLVIVPASMAKGGQALVDYREARFPEATMVRLEDVYDEFTHGAVDPAAIRHFLEYVHDSWDRAPDYVVLAGKGTLDPKDIYGYGTNVLPVLMTTTPEGVFASDNRFADISNSDGDPEFFIGRIPVLSSSRLSGYVQKLAEFESAGVHPGSKWTLMLADDADNAGNFPVDSLAVSSYLPGWLTVEHVAHTAGGDAGATRQQILDALAQGAGLFNYLGHGAQMQLGIESFWQIGDLAEVHNGDRLPVFAAFTCYAGNGTYPGVNSIAEEMTLLNGGGAIAAFAPTGISVNREAVELNKAFVGALYGGSSTLGQAVQSAIAEYGANDGYQFIKDVYGITGDPAVVVQQ